MNPVVISTFFGPTRFLITSIAFISMSSVRSRRVPVGARNRNCNCFVSTAGKISVPSRG